MDNFKLSKISEQEIVGLITDLVSIPSYPGVSGQETAVAEYIQRFFRTEGIEAQTVPVIDGRSNVIARLKGTGEGRKLMLVGHLDTVPPYDMGGDPFKARLEAGKLFGRGVVDMKGAIASMMGAMAAIRREGSKLAGDLIFAGVIDEENTSQGTRALLNSGIEADGAIVGEPSNLEICAGHRGLEWFEFRFQGKTVHGGKQAEGVNAILHAAKFIQQLEEELLPKLETRTHPILGRSSMNYGVISGGTQPSTVAGECILQIDRRWVPGEKFQDIIGEYQSIFADIRKKEPAFAASMKIMDNSYMAEGIIHEASIIDLNHPLVKAAEQAYRENRGRVPEITSFSAWTDAGLLSSYGKIPTIVLGPGNLESAHSARECLDIAQVVPAVRMYAAIAREFCGGR